VNQSQAIEKAKEFARTRYYGETENISREQEQKIAEMRSRLGDRGVAMSGTMIAETARIHGEQIRAMIQVRLDGVLEGYELYEIPIDDQMATDICGEVVEEMNRQICRYKCPTIGGFPPAELRSQYPRMVAQAVSLSANLIKTQIDRRRLMTKKKDGATTIYNVLGDNARWNVNSPDNSVNIVTKSSDEFFADLRERIASGVPQGEEQKMILQKLDALKEANGKPSFAQTYTDFIAAAANHIVLLTPFIPALTEMVHKVLG